MGSPFRDSLEAIIMDLCSLDSGKLLKKKESRNANLKCHCKCEIYGMVNMTLEVSFQISKTSTLKVVFTEALMSHDRKKLSVCFLSFFFFYK